MEEIKDRVLIVEDDIDISDMIQSFLKYEFDFHRAYDGEEGLEKIRENKYDLVILDIMMPKLNGTDMLKILREENNIPVIILSAKGSEMDKALGFGIGADDYLSKPFSMIELQARMRAIIRRSRLNYHEKKEDDIIKIGQLELNQTKFSLSKNGEEINLTAKEFEILRLFMKNPDRVYTKAQLYYVVWGEEYYKDDNVINVHVRRLREKIEDDPSNPKYIVTLWGIGYKLGGEL